MNLFRVWFCKSRFCPMCNWRRTMKHGIQTQKIVAEVIRQKPKARWLFLTLTVKNVYDGEELNKSLSAMAQGFRRMMQDRKSTRLNSSHVAISYAVFCLKKKIIQSYVLRH